ncbi:UDP-N-acetylmuramoyl-L-alanine--D-glutamate ligase [Nitratidesulfovibrio sp. SRB-5]|uniref:UDP-N-acetylmuramoyl-L-alanine--D-glutamate ligase n=1 Tax=Nitratidesulfovibrio sp. SRB-5 TaxID=2872636 RepID=UPI001026478B|nr:UDP-N-acetylmuramoyl-L-alanine--D-glutamate ligase [Nitratidesulfovibrio sp. SRB-5]MBZ2173568.1 UDP-N-acetylmuramoyl-L-alanine--D-glutamate ligase [Nitratidesulfovibrio sp. SRB-5]RXF78291.1 UDP-N-acetylmuramoyl-L-alanine--D-glutamate ligase [Desulfovibrio sp. DS-1]
MTCDKHTAQTIGKGDLVVVVGAGRSGMAAARLLHRMGARVRLLERNADGVPADFVRWAAEAGVEIATGDHVPTQFEGARAVVPSPGMAVAKLRPLLPQGPDAPEIMAEMELAWRQLDGEPVLAVTGTSGKTTTVSLCAAMLRAQGLSVFLGGNIGTPLSEYVLSVAHGGADGQGRADVLVIEISSFQLQACTTFRPRVAMLLNISENHLDYHADMAEYIDAKFRLFRCMEEGDLAIFGQGVRDLVAARDLKPRTLFFDAAARRFPRTSLLGGHNQANIEAAWQACREFGVTPEAAEKAVADFAPMEHRLEAVAERNGVLWVNDSKCTTVEALRVALQAFDRPVVLMVGGKFKGGDLASLLPLLCGRVRAVVGFGASREHFEGAWMGQGDFPMSWHPALEPAVAEAAALARPGDAVVMAPATSSFDLFANYKERGHAFRRAVEALP